MTIESVARGAIVCVVGMLSFLGPGAGTAAGASISYSVGDNDGFGGTTACGSPTCTAGVAYTHISAAIAPGTYVGVAGTDASTVAPWKPYAFQFDFSYDTTAFSSLDGAQLTVQSGSLARRDDGSGFGRASVSLVIGNVTYQLGDLLTTSTGQAASAAEESVKHSVFDVLPYLPAAGSFTLRIDGGTLDPVDQFAFDYVRLDISGSGEPTSVPESSGASLMAMATAAIVTARRVMSGRLLA